LELQCELWNQHSRASWGARIRSILKMCIVPPARSSLKAVFTPSLGHCYLCRYQWQAVLSLIKLCFVCGGIRFPPWPRCWGEVVLSKPFFWQKVNDLHMYNKQMTGHHILCVCVYLSMCRGLLGNGFTCFLMKGFRTMLYYLTTPPSTFLFCMWTCGWNHTLLVAVKHNKVMFLFCSFSAVRLCLELEMSSAHRERISNMSS